MVSALGRLNAYKYKLIANTNHKRLSFPTFSFFWTFEKKLQKVSQPLFFSTMNINLQSLRTKWNLLPS